MVKISVIVPVLNGQNHLEKCLESISNQSLADIEIICIDDGSTDSTPEIIERFASGDERFVTITQDNAGVGQSRNTGIERAKGKYIFFADSDDWLERDALERLYENAESNGSQMVLFNSAEIGSDFKNERIYIKKDESTDYSNFTFDYNLNKRLVMNRMHSIWSKLYATSFLQENNIRFDNYSILSNIGFHVKTMLMADSISYLPKILYNYSRLNENCLQSNTDLNHRKVIFDVFDDIENFLRQNNFFDEFELNFYEFKINESRVNLNRTSDEYKSDFYRLIRKEFLKMDIDVENLIGMPKQVYKFYMFVLNIQHYELYEKFHRLKNGPFKYVNKSEIQKKLDEFDELGITENKRNPRIIVSLTSFPKRMDDIVFCLYSLLNQTLKPDEVVLWLTVEEFPNGESDVPAKVLDLTKNGLTIKWCNNLRSYTKLVPSLKEYPDDFIVTADDDLYYPKDWLDEIWQYHLKYPDCIISQRSRRLVFNEDGSPKPYGAWKLIDGVMDESYLNLQTGVGGVLYFPNSLSKEVLKEDVFKEIAPSTDDLWFWAMAVLNGVKIKPISNSQMVNLCYVNYAREFGFLGDESLWRTNSTGGNVNSLKNILKHYPEIMKIIEDEVIQ